MKDLNRKQRDKLAVEKRKEIETMKARLKEIDGFEVITEENDDEYFEVSKKVKALQHEVFLLEQPVRRICRNTQALVSANID